MNHTINPMGIPQRFRSSWKRSRPRQSFESAKKLERDGQRFAISGEIADVLHVGITGPYHHAHRDLQPRRANVLNSSSILSGGSGSAKSLGVSVQAFGLLKQLPAHFGAFRCCSYQTQLGRLGPNTLAPSASRAGDHSCHASSLSDVQRLTGQRVVVNARKDSIMGRIDASPSDNPSLSA
jgi:hypothetical protein